MHGRKYQKSIADHVAVSEIVVGVGGFAAIKYILTEI